MTRSIPRLVAAGVAAATTLAITTAADAAPSRGRGTVTLRVTHSHAVVAPARLHPGLVHLRESGTAPLIIVKARHRGLAARDLARDFTATSKRAVRRAQHDFVVQNILIEQQDLYVRLSPGRYFVADIATERAPRAGQLATITVSGSVRNASAPASVPVVVHGNGSLTTATHLPRSGYLHVENRTGSEVIVELIRIGSHSRTAQLRAYVAHPTERGVENLDIREILPVIFPVAHQDSYIRVHLRTSRYLVIATSESDSSLHRGQVRLASVG